MSAVIVKLGIPISRELLLNPSKLFIELRMQIGKGEASFKEVMPGESSKLDVWHMGHKTVFDLSVATNGNEVYLSQNGPIFRLDIDENRHSGPIHLTDGSCRVDHGRIISIASEDISKIATIVIIDGPNERIATFFKRYQISGN